MIYDRAFFDTPIDRSGTRCEKWDDRKQRQPGDIPLWVADWDFRCAEPILEALRARAAQLSFGYSCDDPRDQEAFCAYWKRRHDVDILPEQTFMLPSVVTGLRQAVMAFSKPGDGVVIFTPVYGPFHDAVTRAGRILRPVPLIRDENARYSVDFDGLEARLREGVRLILFCNPHNPVSRTWSVGELSRLAALARAYHAVLVCDEIHGDFVYKPNEHHSILTIGGADGCAVMLASASKTFNVPGLQQSMAVSRNESLLAKIRENALSQGVSSGNAFALDATQAAYTACDDWLEAMLDYLEESRRIVRDELAARLPRAVLTPIEATALCWIDLRAYAQTCDELDARIRAHGLVLTRGTYFDKSLGEGFMRLNFACPHSSLREGIRRLAAAMNEEQR